MPCSPTCNMSSDSTDSDEQQYIRNDSPADTAALPPGSSLRRDPRSEEGEAERDEAVDHVVLSAPTSSWCQR